MVRAALVEPLVEEDGPHRWVLRQGLSAVATTLSDDLATAVHIKHDWVFHEVFDVDASSEKPQAVAVHRLVR